MQDLLQTPFDGYNNKEELIESIKYFVEQYNSSYVGLIYEEINMQNYLGSNITSLIIDRVRSKYPDVKTVDVWKKQRQDLNYVDLINNDEVKSIISSIVNEK